jgi:hypothetical protein
MYLQRSKYALLQWVFHPNQFFEKQFRDLPAPAAT